MPGLVRAHNFNTMAVILSTVGFKTLPPIPCGAAENRIEWKNDCGVRFFLLLGVAENRIKKLERGEFFHSVTGRTRIVNRMKKIDHGENPMDPLAKTQKSIVFKIPLNNKRIERKNSRVIPHCFVKPKEQNGKIE